MITRSLLREWDACWSRDDIAASVPEHGRTPSDVAADESISLDDRLWVLCRSLWYLDESAARGFAIESAALACHLAGDEDDQAQFAGLLNDLIQIEEEVPVDHRAAARDAAWDAAWDAARDASWAAARDAAWAAARDAARAAAWDAAWDAARDAARDAELSKAIARALEWLGDYADGWEEQ